MNPLALSQEVEQRYRRYLKTTFCFKDPQLRRSFEEALDSGRLSKGPYLEATPVFKRGKPPGALFETLLGFQPDGGFLKAVEGDRPLYQHQEEAVRKVFRDHNIVVATGTGSGKTEAFLFPILLHLYQELRAGQLGRGVRALILYPMNALANDQRERLGGICRRLKEANSPFRFTFGQYIGETPEDETDSQRHAQDHIAERARQGYSVIENGNVVHGEMVLRSEMRRAPPHILLTNYSMLEYLLLRPADSPLFDNGAARWWTFLVLDEAHQYRGSRGIEMAMLLRRLKQRLREGGRSEPFRCIATSATLVGGGSDRADVARFASDLFGEEFSEEDVVLGETIPLPQPGPERLAGADYQQLKKALQAGSRAELTTLADKLGVSLPDGEELETTVGRLLECDGRATDLRRLITGNPMEVQRIADQVFNDLPENQRASALADLIELLLRAKGPSSGAPLLSARYHLFLRSLEGAFVSYWPEKRVFLGRRSVTGESPAFEVALCRECGQHYFVAQKNFKGGKIQEAIRDPNDVDFGATFLRPLENEIETNGDEDDGDATDGDDVFYLCIQCGEARPTESACGHSNRVRVVKEHSPGDEDRADQLARCGACGYSAAGRDPVREVVHGTDAPHVVIATTLYQKLPRERRKVLAFADGRQEAAFFAWYLEDSYRDILERNLLLRVIEKLSPHSSEGLSLAELAKELRSTFRQRQVFSPATGDVELGRKAWLSVYREFLTDEQRISLEGVGLTRWSIKWPDWFETPEVLMKPPWSLSEQEARDLVLLLLDTMRADGAVELRTEPEVSLHWDDLKLQASQMRFRIGDPKGKKDVRSWEGERGKRAGFLAKLLERISSGLSEQEAVKDAVEALKSIWDAVKQFDERAFSSKDRLLLPDDGRRLNPDWWRVRLINAEDTVFRCDTCGRLQPVSVCGVCPRHRCPGALKPVRVSDLEPNHYRSLYEEDLPGMLRVEEHTAQLDKEKAREFQREFRNGNIHVLSCSTTFELGVDLGDLDIIFLRNVPPEAFNYAQRVGRAGRRSGYPGFAITYCRRGPHDLYHFSEPERMLTGTIRPPVLSLRNEKVLARHVAAVALSCYFRDHPEKFETVKSLFGDLANPSGVADFRNFLSYQKGQLQESLQAIVPIDMRDKIGLNDGGWIERVAGEDSRLALTEAEVSSDYRAVKELEKAAADTGEYDTAKWARARANTIAQEDVLSFLSRKAVIPKYGFPVDVVGLDTQRIQQHQEAFEVLLERDLSIAISEFAPTSKLVANKKVWTSYGLKRVAEKEWPRKFYKRCARHNVFHRWEPGQAEPPTPCGDKLPVARYLIPLFGFVTNRDRPEEPKSRAVRAFTTRPYFAGSLGPEPDTITIPADSPKITMKKASPGLMVVLCEGRHSKGFYVCGACGAGFRRLQKTHETPYGQACHGMLEQVSLGHEFVTDVLQLQFYSELEEGVDPLWFAHSIAYALVEGAAEVLEVPPSDLSATVGNAVQGSLPPIILYDDVPGGAGLVSRLENPKVFRDCLDTALARVDGNCGCEEHTSCYGCLRNYRNQFAHQHLQRGPVLRYLNALLLKWPPERDAS